MLPIWHLYFVQTNNHIYIDHLVGNLGQQHQAKLAKTVTKNCPKEIIGDECFSPPIFLIVKLIR